MPAAESCLKALPCREDSPGHDSADEVAILLQRPREHSEVHLAILVYGHNPDHRLAEAVARDQHHPGPHPSSITGIAQARPAEPVIVLSVEVSYQVDLRLHRASLLTRFPVVIRVGADVPAYEPRHPDRR